MIEIKKKRELINLFILGGLFVVLGIMLIVQTIYYGIILLFIGLIIVLSKKGIRIDEKNKRLMHYFKIVFYTSGNWEDFSDISYIALVKVSLSQQMNVVSVTGSSSEVQTKMNFVKSNNKVVPIYTDRKTKIFPLAEKIAKAFHIDIYDNTEGKKHWIKYKSE